MKQDLVTGKIKSIDRNKGRIEVYLKNGLTTTASYLYDIATLQENMNVLVALVNNSYVILNQVENVPRVGTSFSVRRPVLISNLAFENIPMLFEVVEGVVYLLLLNFEGTPNTQDWTEEAQGLSFDYADDSSPQTIRQVLLDNTVSYVGTTCLSMRSSQQSPGWGYVIPGLESASKFSVKFWFNQNHNWTGSSDRFEIEMWGSDPNPYIDWKLYKYGSSEKMYLHVDDVNNSHLSHEDTYSLGYRGEYTWHKFEMQVLETSVVVLLDDIEVMNVSMPDGANFNYLNVSTYSANYWSDPLGFRMWIDNLSITNL